jgi:hypothetical protein
MAEWTHQCTSECVSCVPDRRFLAWSGGKGSVAQELYCHLATVADGPLAESGGGEGMDPGPSRCPNFRNRISFPYKGRGCSSGVPRMISPDPARWRVPKMGREKGRETILSWVRRESS